MKAQPFKLMARDRQILEFVARFKFATANEIGTRFWPELVTRHHHRRLQQLSKARYLVPVRGDLGRVIGFAATTKGRALCLSVQGKARKGQKAVRYRTTYDHDIHVRFVLQLFEAAPGIIEILPEHALRSRAATPMAPRRGFKVPDGLCVIDCGEGPRRLAIEVELAQKSVRRYVELIDRLRFSRSFDAVLVIYGKDHIRRQFMRHLDRAKARDRVSLGPSVANQFHFVALQSLREDGLRALPFGQSADGERLAI